MGWGTGNIGGGSGVGLNFKVLGNPQPTNPKENTIWVDTDEKITGWVLSAEQPENPTEGMVWISTSTSSPTAFNALKKNNITVYPLSAKQYVSGAWVDKTAKIYQGGAWVDWWDGKLYESGNEFEYVTGGWYALGKSWDGSQGAGGGTITRNSTTMVIVPTGSPSPVMFIVNNKIDLTDYTTLNYDGTFAGSMQNSDWVRMCAWSELGSTINSNIAAGISMCVAGSGVRSLDVSHLKGEHYVGICFYAKATLTMNKMWLE